MFADVTVRFLISNYLLNVVNCSVCRSSTYIGSLLLISQMQTLLFISGKNWILSLAELTSYFRARAIEFKIDYFSTEFFTLTFEKELSPAVIDDLGGTIKIANLKAKVPTETVKEAFIDKTKSTQKQVIKAITESGALEGMAKA